MGKRDGQHTGRYILDGKVPVPCEDLLVWARWVEEADQQRIVKQEDVGRLWVSTVFLGLDHNYFSDPPDLFETMIFRNATVEDRAEWKDHGWSSIPRRVSLDEAPMWRTSTWELALEQHVEAVVWAREHQDG